MNIGTWAIRRLVSMYGSAHPFCVCLAAPLDQGPIVPVMENSPSGLRGLECLSHRNQDVVPSGNLLTMSFREASGAVSWSHCV